MDLDPGQVQSGLAGLDLWSDSGFGFGSSLDLGIGRLDLGFTEWTVRD